MDIEAYKVAVRLSLTENVTAGLIGLTRHFAAAENSAARLRNQLTSIGKMTAVGGGLMAIGFGLTKGLDAALKSAKDVARAQADFKTLNLNATEMAEVNAKAMEQTHKTLGSTIAGNIRLIQDLHTAFGDLHHALEFAPQFTRYETVVKAALGERAADGAVNAMARALEHRGGKVVNDPKEFQKELAMATQVQLATRNRVSPKDYLQASQTGKMAYALLSPEYLYGQFAGLMSMNGGFQSGTALMTAFSSLIGGHMDKKAKGFLADIGMYEEGVSKNRLKLMQDAMKGMSADERKIYMQSIGGESLLAGGLKSQYAAMFANPDQLAAEMAKNVRARFGQGMTDEQVAELIAKNFNRNTGNFIGQHILNRTKFAKDTAIFRHAQDYNAAYDTYMNSPDGAALALSSSWTNLKAVIGLQLLPTVTKLTMGLAKLFDKMSEFAEKHPTLTKMATYAIAAAAGLTTIAGAVTLLGAAIMAARVVSSLGVVSSLVGVLGGPLVWAAMAAAAAGLLIYKNWDRIKSEAKKMGEEFGMIMSDIGTMLKQVGNHVYSNFIKPVEEGFDSFAGKMQRGWNGIYDYIIGILNKIPGANFLTSSEQNVKGNALQLMQDIHSITSGEGKAPVSGIYTESAKTTGGQSFAEGMRQTAAGMSAPQVVSKNDQMIQVYSNLHMDGKKIAEGVTTHQVKQASRAPTGPSGVDSSMNLIHAGMGSLVPR
ncbi:hypothetical protein PI91_12815 [Enterobacter sp. FB]|uniref:hypothetical protein n=1 Tax=Enterobacter sp. FB TaxID=1571816 RepID=UPI0005746934|nr:hypothetical protein [Enterobacter sp. FB]KHO34869.1 hypothetical protein PI91_12815 [Enterobacter sp. FB]OIR49548.1 hypothetical protein BH716_12985 [Lelliottia nimipressuralis]